MDYLFCSICYAVNINSKTEFYGYCTTYINN